MQTGKQLIIQIPQHTIIGAINLLWIFFNTSNIHMCPGGGDV